jgi:D-alanine-D-alanine ligase
VDNAIAYDLVPASGAHGPVDRFEEYDSRATIDAVASALSALGHRPRCLGGGRRFLTEVLAQPPELVFNMAEGFGGSSREAHVPSVCEMLAIPYTHSDPLTLTTTLDKPTAKRVVDEHGLRTPPFAVV